MPSESAYVLLYDKPPGVTSHDVVAQVRRTLPRKTKVGHAGTLDPFATGLLLILVGRATRAQRFFMELPKRYEATAVFGATSSTGDPEGEILVTGVTPPGDLSLPTGRIRQRPPAYSAVKIDGRRAYQRARAGETVETAEREVEVYRFAEIHRDGDRRGFEIECSSGTYIRSLIADLGDAYTETLRRTAIGDFTLERADPKRRIPLGDALHFLPEFPVTDEHADHIRHGRRIENASRAEGTTRLIHDGQLIALAEPTPSGDELQPVVGFMP